MSRDREATSLRRSDAACDECWRKFHGMVRDPAVWAWAAVALLALLPLREVLAGG